MSLFSYCPHLNISYHTMAKLFIEKISLYIRECFAVTYNKIGNLSIKSKFP